MVEETKVSQRHVQRLWAEYLKTGTVHTRGRAGRLRGADPSDAEAEMVLDKRVYKVKICQQSTGMAPI